jgi:6-phosphogluconolactonase
MIIPLVVADAPGFAAGVIAAGLRIACRARGTGSLAVSGGTTPAAMFQVLATADLPWDDVHLFEVDERVAPDGHPDRNATGLAEHLLGRVPIPAGNVHLMPVTDPDLGAARAYDDLLAGITGGVLDIVHLGLGDDGHTASWPPGDPVSDRDDGPGVAVVGPFNGRLRMTLTPPAVNRARTRVWLVAGRSKAPAVEGVVAGDRRLPASKVRRDNNLFVVDPDAAPGFRLRPGS